MAERRARSSPQKTLRGCNHHGTIKSAAAHGGARGTQPCIMQPDATHLGCMRCCRRCSHLIPPVHRSHTPHSTLALGAVKRNVTLDSDAIAASKSAAGVAPPANGHVPGCPPGALIAPSRRTPKMPRHPPPSSSTRHPSHHHSVCPCLRCLQQQAGRDNDSPARLRLHQ
jgi:hypothetical protein